MCDNLLIWRNYLTTDYRLSSGLKIRNNNSSKGHELIGNPNWTVCIVPLEISTDLIFLWYLFVTTAEQPKILI